MLGLSVIWYSMLNLWALWSTDPLKSIGMLVPVVSFLLVLRAWRSLGWEMHGTWWGLALLLGTAALVHVREQAVMLIVLAPQWTLTFPPHSLVMFAYGAAVVLLFGGVRLFRAALFPLLLLVLVNPVPHVFNVFVDLPLQRASAHVARAFAMALGQPLSPDKLRLMFTPEFGMFIAPGCNGIRGAVTMGLIALVAGYLYRFRWRALLLTVLGAVALGYLFNLVRLCMLVLFYLVALHVPSLQDRAENADYLIGAGLFFVAVYLLYTVIQRVGAQRAVLQLPVVEPEAALVPRGFFPRTTAFAVVVTLGLVNLAHGMRLPNLPEAVAAEDRAEGQFPQTAGSYTLVRTWNEELTAGALLFHWAEYAPAGGGTHISIGVSPVLGAHDTMVCHTARGDDPIWHGEEAFVTGSGAAVSFNTSLYNDGAMQYLEASTLCTGTSCGEYASPQRHFGLVWSRPDADSLLSTNPSRPIPILLRAETIDDTLPKDVARQQLSADLTNFLKSVSLEALTQRYRRG